MTISSDYSIPVSTVIQEKSNTNRLVSWHFGEKNHHEKKEQSGFIAEFSVAGLSLSVRSSAYRITRLNFDKILELYVIQTYVDHVKGRRINKTLVGRIVNALA